MHLEPAGHESPGPAQLAIGKRDPILIARDNGHMRLCYSATPYPGLSIVHFDPPFAPVRPAQFELVTNVQTLRAIGAKTLSHPIEHILWLMVERFARGRATTWQHAQQYERGC